jgi:hypothetical protein
VMTRAPSLPDSRLAPEERARKISNDGGQAVFSRRGIWRGGYAESTRRTLRTSFGSGVACDASRESTPTRRGLFRAARPPPRARVPHALVPVSKNRRDRTCLIALVRFDRGIDRGETRETR